MKPPKRSTLLFLKDIEQSIGKIDAYTDGASDKKFFEEIRIQDAVIRRLEIIGEAMKNIPVEFKEKHSEIAWDKMIDLSNVLEHAGSNVDLKHIWLVVKEDLPPLKQKIQKILKELN